MAPSTSANGLTTPPDSMEEPVLRGGLRVSATQPLGVVASRCSS